MSYPHQVWTADTREVLQGVPSRGDGDTWFLTLFGGLEEIDHDVSEVYRGLADPREAVGPVLDIVGDILREPRGGLGDAEYRRILAARRIARNAVSVARVWEGWVALTGSADGRLIELGSSSLYLTAPIDFYPSREWRRRAGEVVTKLVGAGVEVNATVYSPTHSARFDAPGVGFGYGRFAYSLFTGDS
jgi:hypothetical protein